MPNVELSIPARQPSSAANAGALHRPRLREWLDQLPLMNRDETTRKIQDLLVRLNRVATDPLNRFELMDEIRPLAEQMNQALNLQSRQTNTPLGDKSLLTNQRAAALQRELAYAYKIIIDELSRVSSPNRKQSDALRRSCLLALEYLACQVISQYTIYSPDTDRNWFELNQIYLFTEQSGFADVPITLLHGETEITTSCLQQYAGIAVVALSNPFHLMRGEAFDVYSLIRPWLDLVTLTPAADKAALVNHFVVDLATDRPPTFVTDEDGRAEEPRIINLHPLLLKISEKISELATTTSGRVNRNLRFMDRIQRNFYLRLKTAWTGRPARRFERGPDSDCATLAAGLSAAHHFISEGEIFKPEEDEINLKRRQSGPRPKLTLTADHDEAWRAEKAGERVEKGITKHRNASFEAIDVNSDVWESAYRPDLERLKSPDESKPQFITTTWQLRDKSLGGMSLRSDAHAGQTLQVGELIAYGPEGAPPSNWHVGAVRWMRRANSQTADLGIKKLAQSAAPIAVRAVEGTGKGSDYTRSLLIPRVNPHEKPAGLLIPAAIYDTGTVLLVNMGREMFYAKLVEVLDTTKSFTHFLFEVVDPPQTELTAEHFADASRHGGYPRI